MDLIKKNKLLTFFSTFTLIFILLLTTIFLNGIAFGNDEDDEKERTLTCADGQHEQIYCTEGKVDCSPRDCPDIIN